MRKIVRDYYACKAGRLSVKTNTRRSSPGMPILTKKNHRKWELREILSKEKKKHLETDLK